MSTETPRRNKGNRASARSGLRDAFRRRRRDTPDGLPLGARGPVSSLPWRRPGSGPRYFEDERGEVPISGQARWALWTGQTLSLVKRHTTTVNLHPPVLPSSPSLPSPSSSSRETPIFPTERASVPGPPVFRVESSPLLSHPGITEASHRGACTINDRVVRLRICVSVEVPRRFGLRPLGTRSDRRPPEKSGERRRR